MMRVCLLMASVSSVAGQGLSLGAVTLIRDIEGENARTITRAKATERNAELSASMTAPKLMFDSAVCTQALVDLHATYPRVTVVQLELSEDVSSAPVALAGDVSAGSASHVGWSRPGSFLPYDANKGTDEKPGVCHKTKGWLNFAVACGILNGVEKCAPAPCQGDAAKVGEPCCGEPVGWNSLGGDEYIYSTAGEICRDTRKGSLCGPAQSTAGYDEGDENTGLCAETIFDIPIVLFFVICIVALVIIFFQCALMGLFDILCVSKETFEDDDEKRP